MIAICSALAISVGISQVAHANLTGYVTNAVTGAPIAGVKVASGAIQASSDGTGYYSLAISNGTFDVRASKLQMKVYRTTVTIPSGNTTLNIALDTLDMPVLPHAWYTFDNSSNPLYAYTGNDLELHGTHTTIAGPVAGNNAITIGNNSWYGCTHDIPHNGSTSTIDVNNYSLVYDVRIASLGQYHTLYNTNNNNVNDGDLWIRPDGAIGSSVVGYSANKLHASEWYRIFVSVRLGNHFTVYVDGQQWLEGNSQPVNGRFSLYSMESYNKVLFFADGYGDSFPFDVSTVGVFDHDLSSSEVAAFGGFSQHGPDAPLGLSPASVTVADLTPTLTWLPANNATAYDVYLGTEASPVNLVSVDQVGTSYTVTTPLSSYNATYYWKVVSKNSIGTAASATAWFMIPFPPDYPTNPTVTNLASSSLTLNWTDRSNFEDGYRIYQNTSSDFASATLIHTTAASVVTRNITGLSSGTTYYFWIYAFRGELVSTTSANVSATTIADYSGGASYGANNPAPTGGWTPSLPPDPLTGNHAPVTLTFPANGSGNPTSVTVSYLTTIPPVITTPLPATSTIQKSWQIDAVGGTNFSATLDLYFTSNDIPAELLPIGAQLGVGSFNAVTGVLEHVYNADVSLFQAGSPNIYVAHITGVTQFSIWVLGQGGVLPVELSAFTASILPEGIKLQWRTESETSNRHFRIERWEASRPDERITVEVRSQAAGGNSATPLNYSYLDNDGLMSGGLYYYRLTEIGLDGRENVLRIITVAYEGLSTNPTLPVKFGLLKVYPNPFNASTTISFSVREAGLVQVGLYNINGQLVKTLFQGSTGASEPQTLRFDATGMAAGLYFVKLSSDHFTTEKKLVYMK